MNRVILYGRVVSEPQRRSPNSPCEFRLETIDEWKGERQDGKMNKEYHTIAAWTKLGDRCMDSLKKGDLILVEGFLKHNRVEKILKDQNGSDVIVNGSPYKEVKVYTEIKAKTIKGFQKRG